MLVTKLNKQYDANKIFAELTKLEKNNVWGEITNLSYSFSVSSRDGTTTDGAKAFAGDERKFKILEMYKGTYILEVIKDLNITCGRIRFLKMLPGHIMKMHFDPSIRYHIPIITNPYCGFLDEDLNTHTMNQPGSLYKLDATEVHSAFNCSSNEERIHLVVVEAY